MINQKNNLFFVFFALALTNFAVAQIDQSKGSFEDKFRQLDEAFPSPDLNRPATGQPRAANWQQRSDYKIKIKLDELAKSVEGLEFITYPNNSPLKLNYIWLQLDHYIFIKYSYNNLILLLCGGYKL